jgi:hypothetical protein
MARLSMGHLIRGLRILMPDVVDTEVILRLKVGG